MWPHDMIGPVEFLSQSNRKFSGRSQDRRRRSRESEIDRNRRKTSGENNLRNGYAFLISQYDIQTTCTMFLYRERRQTPDVCHVLSDMHHVDVHKKILIILVLQLP